MSTHMTRLDDIGFYTLSDARALQTSACSPLWRCEMILTDACNFKCGYCRGVKPEYRGSLPLAKAVRTLSEWQSHGLKHIRFSGGEPTLHKSLPLLVGLASLTCDRVAVSTNGSAPREIYEELIQAGVDDFSVSLDACCASTGNTMAGVKGQWEKVIENIRWLSHRVYTTVGVVLTDKNLPEATGIVQFAHDLGVADIRLIPAAQSGRTMEAVGIPEGILNAHPILKYRIKNLQAKVEVRGLRDTDNHCCPLVLDEVTYIGGNHYPCPIYMREQGKPIGEMTTMKEVRLERFNWFQTHDTHQDPICSGSCLDFCRQFNNTVGNVGAVERSLHA